MNRIDKAINIFLDAINEGTLAKGDCTKCAVGNLVRSGMQLSECEYNIETLRLGKLEGIGYINWSLLFSTTYNRQEKIANPKRYLNKYPIIKEQLEATDFTLEELMKIEYTFEKSTKIIHSDYYRHTKEEIRADQIKGLEAVIKVILEFDDSKEDVKEIFTNKAELIPV